MTLHRSDCSHIWKTYILNIISIHKKHELDALLVAELDAEQSALDGRNCLATHWADGALRSDIVPCLSWTWRRGEKKMGLPNETCWEDERIRQYVR